MENEESHVENSPADRPDDLVLNVDVDNSGTWYRPSRQRSLSRQEYELRHRRLIRAMVAMVFVILIGNGFGWTLYADAQYNLCQERNERAIATGRALMQLERAAIDDNDANQSLVWHNYNAVTSKTPLPKCRGRAFYDGWIKRN